MTAILHTYHVEFIKIRTIKAAEFTEAGALAFNALHLIPLETLLHCFQVFSGVDVRLIHISSAKPGSWRMLHGALKLSLRRKRRTRTLHRFWGSRCVVYDFKIFSTFFNYLGDIPNDIYRLLLRDGLKSLRECNCSSEERLRCTLDTTCARLAVLKIYSNPQKDRHVKSCLNSLELLVYLFGEYYTMKYLNK